MTSCSSNGRSQKGLHSEDGRDRRTAGEAGGRICVTWIAIGIRAGPECPNCPLVLRFPVLIKKT